ncbi:uncharacterized protein RHOBADRAFT_51441 [Rhodotorula graminis WP1]|uniref:Kinase n=1 Tax=Rhodotorula graminis (strain WP1) TaxID=578459 RepID=A0A194SA62_RHOGW|nr:uncharacterized protein RHOBADRAFT_51441 [Rhodotorula graminis WP1]KPV77608.1 hypothetical protein RHOBADRAFT_51441 [Rhodotorula graminis WP1]
MAFAHQVGGHANTILASPLSASTLIKPSSARELAFYQHLAPSLDPHLVGEWTPAFYGTLKLAGKVHPEGGVAQVPPATDVEPEMLVLENLTYRFVRPNVLDIKLGTQLFDEDASPDKQDRMRRAALASTSARAGVRLTGFQVWDHGQQTYVQTDKPFGRALTVDELPLGMARFFYPPLSGPSAAERAAAATATTSSSTASLNPSTSTPTAPTPPPPTPLALPLPLPLHLLLPVLRTLVRRLDDLVHTWSRLALRMRGGSLLVVVEGDPDALERALERAQDEADKTAKAARARRERGVSTATSGGTAAPHTLQAFDVRVIDFAHTRALVDGEEGPDEGVLTGLRTVRALVDGLVERLTELQRSEEDEARER